MTKHPPQPTSATRISRPQIESLIRQALPDEAIVGLRNIFKDYGYDVSVELLPTGSTEYAFLVDFENPQEAVNASLELNYLLFGHSTLVIHARQSG
jgi:hypothetical protein